MTKYKYKQFYKCGHYCYSDIPIKSEYCFLCEKPVETRTMKIIYLKFIQFVKEQIFNYRMYRVNHALHLNWIVVGAVGNIVLCILNLINLWRHW